MENRMKELEEIIESMKENEEKIKEEHNKEIQEYHEKFETVNKNVDQDKTKYVNNNTFRLIATSFIHRTIKALR